MKQVPMKRLHLLFFFLIVVLGGWFSAQAQETLTNETVLRLWRAGMSETFIVERIQQQPGIFQLTGGDLQTLTDNRIPDRVIEAMYAKRSQANQRALPGGGVAQNASVQAPSQQNTAVPPPPPPTVQASAPSVAAPAAVLRGGVPPPPATLPPPSGAVTAPTADTSGAVFYRRGNNWELVLPETMTWQSNGVVKKAARVPSLGIVGRPARAKLFGEHSRTSFSGTPDIVVAVPAGTNMQNYLMVQLKQGKGERILSVGDSRNHAAHNSIQFGAQKVQTIGQYDQYRIEMPDGFAPGEYGVYNVAGVFSPNATSAKGSETAKIYTFSIQ